jgi:putative oxidoreductase
MLVRSNENLPDQLELEMADSAQALSRDPVIRMLRVGVATLLFVHGIFRLVAGGVVPFGEFLSSQGIPFGFGVAASLTFVEIIGCLLLAVGILPGALSMWFVVELIAGIVLVHAKEGWFVVGGGRNGVEYSVLLILVLTAVAWSEQRRYSRSQTE